MIKQLIDRIYYYFKPKKILDETIIIACYYNPKQNPYRLLNFKRWYNSIKHYNHQIIECSIGKNSVFELVGIVDNQKLTTIHTEHLLWHKESLLNILVKNLDKKYKYVFWSDTDIIFNDDNWLEKSALELSKGANLIQPFEHCVHLSKEETQGFNKTHVEIMYQNKIEHYNPVNRIGKDNIWRSFASNFKKTHIDIYGNKIQDLSHHQDYDLHGHVGFIWGAKKSILDSCNGLFDKCLIGGADHLIAHAGAGHCTDYLVLHPCITKAFKDMLPDIIEWSCNFNLVVQSKLSYTKGITLFHLWHGDLKSREYLKRIVETESDFSKLNTIDENGLYINNNPKLNNYIDNYLNNRELVDKPHKINNTQQPHKKHKINPINQYPEPIQNILYDYNHNQIDNNHNYS